MSDDGKPMSEWLNKVTRDQNAWSLSDLIVNRIDDARKWFSSRVITPVIKIGYYDAVSGKIVLGDGGAQAIDTSTTTISTDATSQASKVWTVPTGKRWKLLAAGQQNNNRAMVGSTLTINDGSDHLVCDHKNVAQGYMGILFSGGDTNGGSSGEPFILAAATTITMNDESFVAADVVNKWIAYVEVDA